MRERHCGPKLRARSHLDQLAEAVLVGNLTIEDLEEDNIGVTILVNITMDTVWTAVEDIYERELQKFNFDSLQVTTETEDFVRIVWRGTEELGVAIYWPDFDNEEEVILAFFYQPSYRGIEDKQKMKLNVLRPICDARLITGELGTSDNFTVQINGTASELKQEETERKSRSFNLLHSVQLILFFVIVAFVGLSLWCYSRQSRQTKTIPVIVEQINLVR